MDIRLLNAEEIECRIGTINEKGLSLLLYKDARADMKILDESFGTFGWQRNHCIIGNSLYCTVSIWDEQKQQWISKMDVGTESYTEKEKGQASDSFKRACVSIGIGRELYTAPFIWITRDKAKIDSKNGKYFSNEKFNVSSIEYGEQREIIGLQIINQNGAVVYEYNCNSNKPALKNLVQSERVKTINKELKRTGVALETVLMRYGVSSIDDMSEEDYKRAMNGLKKTKAA